MRKLIIVLAIAVVLSLGAGALWLFCGARLSLFTDQWITRTTSSQPIKSLVYDGNGSGGVLRCDGFELSLNNSPPNPQPNVGTTKNDELALSFGGKVFSFGRVPSGTDLLTCEISPDDRGTISTWHSTLSWPTSLSFNFMTGKSPSWKRYTCRQLTWTKPDGAKLDMSWRYEQHFLAGDGWTEALMIGPDAPGLIRVDISNGAR